MLAPSPHGWVHGESQKELLRVAADRIPQTLKNHHQQIQLILHLPDQTARNTLIGEWVTTPQVAINPLTPTNNIPSIGPASQTAGLK